MILVVDVAWWGQEVWRPTVDPNEKYDRDDTHLSNLAELDG